MNPSGARVGQIPNSEDVAPPTPPPPQAHTPTTQTNTNKNTNNALYVLRVLRVPDRWFWIGSRTTSSRAKRAGHRGHPGRLVPLAHDTTMSYKWLRQKE